MEVPDTTLAASPVASAPEAEPAAVAPVAPVETPVVLTPEPVAMPAPAHAPVLFESPAETPVAAIPGLEYLEEKAPEPVRPAPVQEIPSSPKPEPLTLDPLEPLEPLEISAESFGIQKGSGGRVELTPRVEPTTGTGGSFERFDAPPEIKAAVPDADAAMFEKRDGEAAIPAPPTTPPPAAPASGNEPTMGEFLKMFPDARPD